MTTLARLPLSLRAILPPVTAAVMVTVAGFGCAHQQPPPAKATALATHPAPVVHASAPAPQPSSPAGESYDAGKAAKDAVYFDFDSSLLRDDARPTLQKVADVARKRDASVRIEGNCDELGTTEYNMALGDQRARQAKDYLVKLGVSASRIETVSYGSERPKADGHDDRAHAQNRRDDLILR